MRWRSEKQAAMYRQYRSERELFKQEFSSCMFCGSRGVSVHEILAGCHRIPAFKERACWLTLCGPCNCDEATDHAKWPWERQFAVKLEVDPLGFDLDKVLAILAPRLIDPAEIIKWFVRNKQIELGEAA